MDAVMILGPTASGKTALGVALAKALSGEVISIDSALVYRGMNIGTAKPTEQERAGVPHHLIDIRDPFESYSAADFVKDAERLIAEIKTAGHLPLIVGGTMLYAKALKEGLNDMPAADVELRARLEEKAARLGWPAMHEELAQVDPATAARLYPTDSQRISRALEVFYQTQGSSYTFLTFGLMPGDRARLHERIRERFMQMIEAGFLDEVKARMAMPGFDRNSPSMRAVGYRQAIDYLSGEIDYERFVEAGIAATRQLAKRQMTWMRSMPELRLIDPFKDDALAVSLHAIEKARAVS